TCRNLYPESFYYFKTDFSNILLEPDGRDIYTLPGETRLDINGDGTVDNAWYFTSDLNNDGTVGTDEVIAYSILMDDSADVDGNGTDDVDLNDGVSPGKAAALVTRNGPISTSEVTGDCAGAGDTGQRSAEGWQVVNGTTLEKNFQVNAFVANLNDVSRVASTLEFQQVRSAARSNKWGAWFRYDLNVYPGPKFNWNGAMHTQGSFVSRGDFRAYMISSKSSCLYDQSASEITLGAENASNGFKGQLVLGNPGGVATSGGGPKIHVEQANGNIIARDLDYDKDSIASGTTTADIWQDPVEVYLNDVSTHAGGGWTTAGINGDFAGRVRNIGPAELRINLDDVFRADNRWGPKKVYDSTDAVTGQIPDGTNIGTDIGAISKLTNTSGGLDGYWERQAINGGTRIMVGERLELGDVSGWNYDPRTNNVNVTPGDPLYPPNEIAANNQTPGGKFGYGEQKQRKALRDNLAAVQGMVVYRWDLGSGTTPQACIAVTSHPGTLQSQINSRTFRQLRNDNTKVMTDFLTGNGTNGWEFDAVDPSNGNVSDALTNLAKFAGDPDGGAPSFEPVQNTFVHPYPYMSMWGDYSTLRRIQVEGDGNGSPADDTYQETAACTLGLLAYNLSSVKAEYGNVTAADWKALAAQLISAYTADNALATQGYANWRAAAAVTNEQLVDIGGRYWAVEHDRAYGFITGLGLPASSAGDTFASGAGTYDPTAGTFTVTTAGTTFTDPTYNVTCDPHIFANARYGASNNLDEALALALAICPKQAYYPSLYYLFPVVDHDQGGGEAITIPAGTYGGVSTAQLALTAVEATQPTTEPYIAQTVTAYSQNNSFAAVDYAATGLVATPKAATGSGWTLGTGAASANDAFSTSWGADGSDANLPDNDPFRVVVTDAAGANPSAFTVRAIDKGLYDGRENMVTRMLDLDVGALAINGSNNWIYGKDGVGVEHNGLVYAYREDAVREDEIVRPVSGTPAGCNTYNKLKAYDSATPGCYMQYNPTGTPALANALNITDPPLASSNISLKPIDYTPDPDRRPYGFRLRNGSNLNRASDEQSGISFITDNVVMVQGDFNLHTDGSVFQEEFDDTKIFDLDPNTTSDAAFQTAFYGRTSLNLSIFANSNEDAWRPAEILGDAVYIVSAGFKDGFVEAAYVRNPEGTTGDPFEYSTTDLTGLVSYQNRNPFGNTNSGQKDLVDRTGILREGRGGLTAPVYFDRNGAIYNATGNPLVQDDRNTTANNYYWGFGGLELGSHANLANLRRDSLAAASGETTVNSLIISGITAPRTAQGYGGLHNFPRMLEHWDGTNLRIAGGFFQLFFSNSATAPYDQDSWESTDAQAPVFMINYYTAPNRIWGYDVALQYSPQSPIASRFTSVGDPRSEFYRELPVDDPYIKMLRCAEYTPGVQIDPKASCS
ncbi:MAG: hormogonium polysaccharide biosynthesis protein HpsA, partial [Cyanobacteria bacterium]|nr:hormogonium polysaccharide biosynthesis protein HpsA [Cyanobacteriota bacterium]